MYVQKRFSAFSILLLSLTLSVFLVSCSTDNPLKTSSEEAYRIGPNKAEMNKVLTPYKEQRSEIALVDLNTLARLKKSILVKHPDFDGDRLRSEIFQKLKNIKKAKPSKALKGPTVYHYQLTWQEFWLLMFYPEHIEPTREATNEAIEEARKYWPEDRRHWQDKPDAFRHAYWSILLGRKVALWWSKLYTTAHESEEDDVSDKNMDLHNNLVGRHIYKTNSSLTNNQYSEKVKNYQYIGKTLCRLDKNTNYLVYMR